MESYTQNTLKSTEHPAIKQCELEANHVKYGKPTAFKRVNMNAATQKNHYIAILIPARYHSSRLPGKPLELIAGSSMLARVWAIAEHVKAQYAKNPLVSIQVNVTTEDSRILDYCQAEGMSCLLTSDQCRSGTERVAQACESLAQQPDFIVNLQGDNALCPPWFLEAIIQNYLDSPSLAVITPYVQLSWDALDQLRKEKSKTPFSGTTVVFNTRQEAFWFSKNIIPAVRKEDVLRNKSTLSPVSRHIGLYGYDMKTLMTILQLPESDYERHEGLEQLSFLEAGISIRMVKVDYRGRHGMTGIDSPEDVARAEVIIAQDGELLP